MAYRTYAIPNGFLVNQGGQGDFTTITAAMAVAVVGDIIYVSPGTYIENFTIGAGITLSSVGGCEITPNVIIAGTVTMTATGVATIFGIQLVTNNNYCIVISGSNLCNLILENSYIYASNFSAINLTDSSILSILQLINCTGAITTSGVSFFQAAGPQILIRNTYIASTVASITSTISNGSLTIFDSQIFIPITISGTGNLGTCSSSILDTSAFNQIPLTLTGNTTANLYNSTFNSGTNSAFSIGANCEIVSSNINIDATGPTSAIVGNGSLILTELTFTDNNNTISPSISIVNRSVALGSVRVYSLSEMLSGSTLQIDSGATVQVQNGAVLNINAGASIDVPLSGLLVGKGANVPVVALALTTNGQIPIGGASGPVAAQIQAGAGITVLNGANSITISSTDAGFTWNNTSGTSATLVAENGYEANNAGLVTFTLPSTASSTFGDTIKIMGLGAGGWTIAQLAGQQIIVGSASSTVGVGGSVASTNRYDSIELVYSSTAGLWRSVNFLGNLTVT